MIPSTGGRNGKAKSPLPENQAERGRPVRQGGRAGYQHREAGHRPTPRRLRRKERRGRRDMEAVSGIHWMRGDAHGMRAIIGRSETKRQRPTIEIVGLRHSRPCGRRHDWPVDVGLPAMSAAVRPRKKRGVRPETVNVPSKPFLPKECLMDSVPGTVQVLARLRRARLPRSRKTSFGAGTLRLNFQRTPMVSYSQMSRKAILNNKKVGGRQFLPRLKSWVSLPHDL